MRSTKYLVALCDAESNITLIKDSSLPRSCVPTATTTKHNCIPGIDIKEFYQAVLMEHILLPEFSRGHSIQRVTANVFQSLTWPYDVILRKDFLQSIGMQLSFNNNTIHWMNKSINMKSVPIIPQHMDEITTKDGQHPIPIKTQLQHILMKTALWMKDDNKDNIIKCYNTLQYKLLRINVANNNQLLSLTPISYCN